MIIEEQWGKDVAEESHPVANELYLLRINVCFKAYPGVCNLYIFLTATLLISRTAFWLCLHAYLSYTFKLEETGESGRED